ncbi:MAG: hypothetical protein F2789_14920 [Actinobacteria bacterium]|nr:hypothetical protein [Actinomycetota bacterium]
MFRRVGSAAVIALLGSIAGVAMFGVGRADAHAGLEASTPAASSVLDSSPPLIALNFDEDIEVPLASITLYDQNGTLLPLGSPRAGTDGSIVEASVPTVGDGTYAVVWRVTSADGHVVNGAFSFQIGTGGGVDSAQLINSVLNGARAEPGVGRGLGFARFASFLGAALLIGGLFMVMTADVDAEHARPTRRLLWCGWVLLGVAAFANFALLGANSQAGSISDMFNTSVWGDVAGTRTGGLLLMRLGLVVAFIPVLLFVNRSQRTWWPLSVPLLGLLTVFTFSGAGHPSVTTPPALWMGVDAVHFGAIAVWIGALAMMAFGGRAWLRDEHLVRSVKAFSRMATIGIPLIVISGVVQTWKLAGGFGNLTDTTWGRILLAKSAVAVLLVTLGGASRWLLKHEGPGGLRRMVITETLCGLAVLGLAAGLVAQPPTLAERSKVFTASLTEAGVIVDVSITPGRVGSNEVHLVITPPGGNLTPVVGTTARMSLPARGIPSVPVTLQASGSNHYTGSITLPFAGEWTLEIVVEPKANQTVLLSSAVPIP